MLTYENFVSVLLTSIEQAGLNIAYTQELIDTHALGRSLTITCLPDGAEDDRGPQEPSLRAVVAFRWSPEFTIFSLRGTDSLDNIERFVDERLFAQTRRGPSLDVEVTYHLPLSIEQQRDVSVISTMARAIQDIHSALVDTDDPVRVNSQERQVINVTGNKESQVYRAKIQPVTTDSFRLTVRASANPAYPNAAQLSEIELYP